MNVIQREYAFHTVIISLSQVSVSITFLRILMRIHIPVKEVQLKSTKREKSQISSLTPHLFLPGEFKMKKTNFLWRFTMGNFYIVSLFGITRNTSHNLSTLSSGCFHACVLIP